MGQLIHLKKLKEKTIKRKKNKQYSH